MAVRVVDIDGYHGLCFLLLRVVNYIIEHYCLDFYPIRALALCFEFESSLLSNSFSFSSELLLLYFIV